MVVVSAKLSPAPLLWWCNRHLLHCFPRFNQGQCQPSSAQLLSLCNDRETERKKRRCIPHDNRVNPIRKSTFPWVHACAGHVMCARCDSFILYYIPSAAYAVCRLRRTPFLGHCWTSEKEMGTQRNWYSASTLASEDAIGWWDSAAERQFYALSEHK